MRKFIISRLFMLPLPRLAAVLAGGINDIGWAFYVNVVDLFVAGGGLIATFIVAGNTGLRVTQAQEVGHALQTATQDQPASLYPLLALVLVIVHIILREIVVPLVKGERSRPAVPAAVACTECRQIAVLRARHEEQRSAQLEFNRRLEGNVKRIFELLDERKNPRQRES